MLSMLPLMLLEQSSTSTMSAPGELTVTPLPSAERVMVYSFGSSADRTAVLLILTQPSCLPSFRSIVALSAPVYSFPLAS